MNRQQRNTAFSAVVLMTVLFAGCGTTGGSTGSPAVSAAIPSSSNVDTAPTRMVIRDWSNRSMGIPSTPPWLQALLLGNSGPIKQDFGINGSNRVKFIVAQNRNRESARVQAGLLFAAKTANELKQYVVTGAGSVLDGGELDIVEEIATATKVTIMGNENVADFWQLVETEDTATRQKTQEYLYYIVYSMPEDTWKALVRKYTNDIIGQLPDRAVQTKVAQAFGDIDAAASRETMMTEAQFIVQVDAQRLAAERAYELEQARISGQTAVAVAAATPAVQTKQEIYVSGDPAKIAAASVSAADVDWITALSTAASVMSQTGK
ncbi:hypothetical protein FACS189485_23010 [Spirochaetia bacterium]|nr:hypothetical protein FACS189485_23010 [Spirochaetia bacterium]